MRPPCRRGTPGFRQALADFIVLPQDPRPLLLRLSTPTQRRAPLAVGNSWTYEHDHADRDADYSQWSTYTAQHPKTPQFTIEVLRTEALDGQTYYVISEMPSHWPPPPHFIARQEAALAGRPADGAPRRGRASAVSLRRRQRERLRDHHRRGDRPGHGEGGAQSGAVVFV